MIPPSDVANCCRLPLGPTLREYLGTVCRGPVGLYRLDEQMREISWTLERRYGFPPMAVWFDTDPATLHIDPANKADKDLVGQLLMEGLKGREPLL